MDLFLFSFLFSFFAFLHNCSLCRRRRLCRRKSSSSSSIPSCLCHRRIQQLQEQSEGFNSQIPNFKNGKLLKHLSAAAASAPLADYAHWSWFLQHSKRREILSNDALFSSWRSRRSSCQTPQAVLLVEFRASDGYWGQSCEEQKPVAQILCELFTTKGKSTHQVRRRGSVRRSRGKRKNERKKTSRTKNERSLKIEEDMKKTWRRHEKHEEDMKKIWKKKEEEPKITRENYVSNHF